MHDQRHVTLGRQANVTHVMGRPVGRPATSKTIGKIALRLRIYVHSNFRCSYRWFIVSLVYWYFVSLPEGVNGSYVKDFGEVLSLQRSCKFGLLAP